MKTAKTSIFKVFLMVTLLMGGTLFVSAAKETVKGMVFDDANGNGKYDKGEAGIAGAAVSNQLDVVKTDDKGRFKLPVTDHTVIFVSKPSGYSYHVDKFNIPRFYYIHHPAGSPKGLKYKGIEPTGKLPSKLFFPLHKRAAKDKFDIIVTGDPQTKTAKEVDFYRDDIVTRMMTENTDFYIALGDIMYDDLNLYDRMNKVISQMGIPVHHVMGNHDMNYRTDGHKYEAETFKRVYGPDYYSFNHGRVHFVILNSIKYQGWDKLKKKPGKYNGALHERQLTWLKNDIARVPDDYLVVLTMHIPIKSLVHDNEYTGISNRAQLFKILEHRKHVLALAGHMHFFEYIEFTPEHGWNGKAVFPQITAGAGCGTWWHGPMTPGGVPIGICTDGMPNGFFIFSFNGNKYDYRFRPSLSSPETYFRINQPRGDLESFEVENAKIEVNVFTGTPKTAVTFQLDDKPEAPMLRKAMEDSFFKKIVLDHPDSYKDWMKPTLSTHSWVAPLPHPLTPGLHRLKVTVKTPRGKIYTRFRMFRVKAAPPTSKKSVQ